MLFFFTLQLLQLLVSWSKAKIKSSTTLRECFVGSAGPAAVLLSTLWRRRTCWFAEAAAAAAATPLFVFSSLFGLTRSLSTAAASYQRWVFLHRLVFTRTGLYHAGPTCWTLGVCKVEFGTSGGWIEWGLASALMYISLSSTLQR